MDGQTTGDGGPNAEVTSTDVGPSNGQFGAPCAGNTDCFSGWCVEGPDGYICTKLCEENCPPGYDCKAVTGEGDVAFLCLPRVKKLCSPCLDDTHCGDGVCVVLDGSQRCAYGCLTDAECPEGFGCKADPSGATQALSCQPTSGSCTCNLELQGGQRTCVSESEAGTCYGVETCDQATGWGPCTANEPTVEICDGLDNDCNGLVDDALDEGAQCDNAVEGVGVCSGLLVCMGPEGMLCQGPVPSAETCDYKDNDCDGELDEDFLAGGTYADPAHCGGCGVACPAALPGAVSTSCQVAGGVATCVVDECEQGYVKVNNVQCMPSAASLCQPCTGPAECLGDGAACLTLPDGQFCGQACAANEDCPDGYLCADVGEAADQCVPETDACTCDGTNLELSRSCSVTYDPEIPGFPATTCSGTEACTPDGWGECELPTESCDGIDNDCDGSIDENFKDGGGLYSSVEHCGGCGVSCLALGVPQSNAECLPTLPVPTCSYTCQGGWVDVDGLSDNGCECFPEDTPDIAADGVDSNCDSVDGDALVAVFVAKDGDDQASGSQGDPMLTLAAAIARAVEEGKNDVYVATGVYSENITLADGVSLFGGFASGFESHDPLLFETALLGQPPTPELPATIMGTNIGTGLTESPTIVHGFTILGPIAANQTGANSYGVYLRDCGSLMQVRSNRVLAGPGGNGEAGTSGGDGEDGVDGGDGTPAYDIGNVNASGFRFCTPGVDTVPGGSPGSATCEEGPGAPGGVGGAGLCPVFGGGPSAEEAGQSGGGAQGGSGGLGGVDRTIDTNSNCGLCNTNSNFSLEAGPGLSGSPGLDGGAGAGCANDSGQVVDGHWTGATGATGADGTLGSGGGGGGAGGGVEVTGNQCLAAGPGDCCTVHAAAGCSDPIVSACVCAQDSFCCTGTWDEQCVFQVQSFGCATCAAYGLGGHDMGGAGGGGGSGGCMGSGGLGGLAGGGSFGIFVVHTGQPDAVPVISENTISQGSGGAGGSGGLGGSAGLGGSGGIGGVASQGDNTYWCAGGGGEGGDGGRGGHGGGGGGGCGGASYGIYVHPPAAGALLAPSKETNTFLGQGVGGSPGSAGASLGSSGEAGTVGTTQNANY